MRPIGKRCIVMGQIEAERRVEILPFAVQKIFHTCMTA